MSTRPETYSVGGNSVADMLENNMDSSPREEDNAYTQMSRVGPTGGTTSLRYPQDHVATDSDYVMFNFYRYTPPFKSAGYSSAGIRDTENVARNDLFNYNRSAMYSRAETLAPILLYMPEDVSASYKSNWTGKAFGSLTRDTLLASSAQGFNKLKGAGETLTNAAERTLALTGAQAIRAATQKITGDNLTNDDVFSTISGAILNPNAEMLFGGSEFRTISLNYKLVPRNEKEGRNIKEILTTFKRAMLPSHSIANADVEIFGMGGGDSENTQRQRSWSNLWLGLWGTESKVNGKNINLGLESGFIAVPNLCQITFMTGGDINRNVPQYKMCAITNCDINYTPDGQWATYSDGTPVAYTLSISFQETKLLYEEDVRGGLY
jgi:hypothetical protein